MPSPACPRRTGAAACPFPATEPGAAARTHRPRTPWARPGGRAAVWHGSARGLGAPGAPGDGGFVLYPAPAGFCSLLTGRPCSPAPRRVPAASASASPCPTDTCGLFPALLPQQEVGRDPLAVSPQAPVTFEDVAVRFSAEEWELLEEWQRELHREVTEGTSQLLASLGRALPRCWSQPEQGQHGGPTPPAGESSASGGCGEGGSPSRHPHLSCPPGPSGSPALSALVRLVKEIPEFLFGGPKAGAEPGAAGSGDAAAGSEQMGAGGEHQGCAGWARAGSCPAGHRGRGGSALVPGSV